MSPADLLSSTFLPDDLIMVAFIWNRIAPALEVFDLNLDSTPLDILCAFDFPDVGEDFVPVDLYFSFDSTPSRAPHWTNGVPFSVFLEN